MSNCIFFSLIAQEKSWGNHERWVKTGARFQTASTGLTLLQHSPPGFFLCLCLRVIAWVLLGEAWTLKPDPRLSKEDRGLTLGLWRTGLMLGMGEWKVESRVENRGPANGQSRTFRGLGLVQTWFQSFKQKPWKYSWTPSYTPYQPDRNLLLSLSSKHFLNQITCHHLHGSLWLKTPSSVFITKSFS